MHSTNATGTAGIAGATRKGVTNSPARPRVIRGKTARRALLAGPRLEQFYVRFQTLDDDKDAGDVVSAEILRTDGSRLAYKGELGDHGHRWAVNTPAPLSGSSDWGDEAGWFQLDRDPVDIFGGEGALLVVGKSGGSKWIFTVDVAVSYKDVQGNRVFAIPYQSARVMGPITLGDGQNRTNPLPI